MSRMFKLWKNGRIATVNPFNSCRFNCYGGGCWAAQITKRLEAQWIKGYENGFEPSFVFERMNVSSDADVVWVGYDNYNCDLPELPRGLTKRLIEDLNMFTDVEIKSIPEEEDPR